MERQNSIDESNKQKREIHKNERSSFNMLN